jgi:hypothetical protein
VKNGGKSRRKSSAACGAKKNNENNMKISKNQSNEKEIIGAEEINEKAWRKAKASAAKRKRQTS